MYLPEAPVRPQDDAVETGDTIATLDAVTAPTVALAIWTRPNAPDVTTLDPDTVDDLSFTLPEGSTAAILCDGGYPPAIASELATDIDHLAAAHRRLTGATAIKVRLDVIEDDACRRFHADYVTLRMLCTYRGAGTQWCRATSPDTVQQLATGAVGVFKGRLAMEEPSVLHRSPPRDRHGAPRLLLVLDPA